MLFSSAPYWWDPFGPSRQCLFGGVPLAPPWGPIKLSEALIGFYGPYVSHGPGPMTQGTGPHGTGQGQGSMGKG